jgi:ATP-dependent DNA ligase
MQCKPVTVLPEGKKWAFEIKFDGYRCIAVKRGQEVTSFSRDEKVLNSGFTQVVEALASFRGEFVLDGELVAQQVGDGLPKRKGFRFANGGLPLSFSKATSRGRFQSIWPS